MPTSVQIQVGVAPEDGASVKVFRDEHVEFAVLNIAGIVNLFFFADPNVVDSTGRTIPAEDLVRRFLQTVVFAGDCDDSETGPSLVVEP